MSPISSAWLRLVCLVAISVTVAGCRSTGPNRMPTDKEQADMLALMLPQRIKIQPFTKLKSFNEDQVPDGILAVVRAYDKFGDPVKAVGPWYFELWTYVDASGERKGERLAFWDRSVGTAEEVRLYWTRAQMLEFQLAWTSGIETIKPGGKCILTATYRAPWDETFEDEYILQIDTPAGLMPAQASEAASKAGQPKEEPKGSDKK